VNDFNTQKRHTYEITSHTSLVYEIQTTVKLDQNKLCFSNVTPYVLANAKCMCIQVRKGITSPLPNVYSNVFKKHQTHRVH
jgi:hypothetical protein